MTEAQGFKPVRPMVMIPTYNERDNVEPLLRRILALEVPGLQALVVDDSSPDGTAQVVQSLAEEEPRVHLMVRPVEVKGRGRAGRAGFQACLDLGADAVVEMDGDLSHDPAEIPQLLGALDRFDVVLGSRRVAGGSDVERSWLRRQVTVLSTAYVRALLRLKGIVDVNSGFRAFRRPVLEAIQPPNMLAVGPEIVQETLFRATRLGFTVGEVPIHFREREAGTSKLGLRQLLGCLFTALRLRYLQLRGAIP